MFPYSENITDPPEVQTECFRRSERALIKDPKLQRGNDANDSGGGGV
jgi:hypothetical protein